MNNQFTWLHIGLGSFHRAHQAWYLHRLIVSGDNRWRIAAGNIRNDAEQVVQALAAQGLTGGMSESALAGMYNSYGNNRNTIDRGRNESLAALLDTLNSNRSSALQSYNSQLSAAEQQKMAYQMQLEQALANGSAEILQNKYDTLQNLDNAYAQQILALQQAAAQAARAGAENTRNFASKFGRAKSYGDKTIGTPDAGAVSMARFFEGLAQA